MFTKGLGWTTRRPAFIPNTLSSQRGDLQDTALIPISSIICARYKETQYAARGNTQNSHFEGTEQASDNEVSPELLNVK